MRDDEENKHEVEEKMPHVRIHISDLTTRRLGRQ